MALSRLRFHPALPVVALCIFASDANAQFAVYDPGAFLAFTQELTTLHTISTNIQNALQSVENAAQGLGKGDPVDDILIGARNIEGNLQVIQYNVQTVEQQFRRVFPDTDAVRKTTPAEMDTLGRNWDLEIQQSALAADRSQTTLARIQSNTAAARDVLARAQTPVQGDQGSQLAKLQALVQMLGVVNSDVANLATTFDATERANTAFTAGNLSEDAVAAERRRRLLDYGPTPASSIPEIDANFLQSPSAIGGLRP